MATSPVVPERKKRGALFWILVGVGSLVLLIAAALGAVGFIAYRTMTNAGITQELLKSNPKFAAHKMVVMVNPDLEVVSENPATDEIIVRSKSKGATLVHRMAADGKSATMEPVPEPVPEKAKAK
jgi:hypothetical protein